MFLGVAEEGPEHFFLEGLFFPQLQPEEQGVAQKAGHLRQQTGLFPNQIHQKPPGTIPPEKGLVKIIYVHNEKDSPRPGEFPAAGERISIASGGKAGYNKMEVFFGWRTGRCCLISTPFWRIPRD